MNPDAKPSSIVFMDPPLSRFVPGQGTCQTAHLMCVNLEALHHVASELGLKREYFQAEASTPHYDIWGEPLKKAKKLPITILRGQTLAGAMRLVRANNRKATPAA